MEVVSPRRWTKAVSKCAAGPYSIIIQLSCGRASGVRSRAAILVQDKTHNASR